MSVVKGRGSPGSWSSRFFCSSSVGGCQAFDSLSLLGAGGLLVFFPFLFFLASAVFVAGPLDLFTRAAVVCLFLVAPSGGWLWGVLSGVGSSIEVLLVFRYLIFTRRVLSGHPGWRVPYFEDVPHGALFPCLV